MLLPKSAFTLLSTVSASSVPVVSVVVLYKIKTFSQGNNLEMTSSTSTEENVIVESQPEIAPSPPIVVAPEPAAPTTTQTTTPTPTPANTPPSPPAAPKPSEKKVSDNDDESTAVVVSKATKTQTTEIKSTDSEGETKKINTAEEMTNLVKSIEALAKQMLEGKTHTTENDQNLAENIKSFIDLLKQQEKVITDKGEKASIKEVIDSLTKLQQKSSTSKT